MDLGGRWKKREIVQSYGEQTRVHTGPGAVTDFAESEGDNAEVIQQGEAEISKRADQEAVIAEQEGSGDATSAQSTGKMDPRAPGWTKS